MSTSQLIRSHLGQVSHLCRRGCSTQYLRRCPPCLRASDNHLRARWLCELHVLHAFGFYTSCFVGLIYLGGAITLARPRRPHVDPIPGALKIQLASRGLHGVCRHLMTRLRTSRGVPPSPPTRPPHDRPHDHRRISFPNLQSETSMTWVRRHACMLSLRISVGAHITAGVQFKVLLGCLTRSIDAGDARRCWRAMYELILATASRTSRPLPIVTIVAVEFLWTAALTCLVCTFCRGREPASKLMRGFPHAVSLVARSPLCQRRTTLLVPIMQQTMLCCCESNPMRCACALCPGLRTSLLSLCS